MQPPLFAHHAENPVLDRGDDSVLMFGGEINTFGCTYAAGGFYVDANIN